VASGGPDIDLFPQAQSLYFFAEGLGYLFATKGMTAGSAANRDARFIFITPACYRFL